MTVGVFVLAIFPILRSVDTKGLGVGLAIAVLIDATLVRAVLLPATMSYPATGLVPPALAALAALALPPRARPSKQRPTLPARAPRPQSTAHKPVIELGNTVRANAGISYR